MSRNRGGVGPSRHRHAQIDNILTLESLTIPGYNTVTKGIHPFQFNFIRPDFGLNGQNFKKNGHQNLLIHDSTLSS